MYFFQRIQDKLCISHASTCMAVDDISADSQGPLPMLHLHLGWQKQSVHNDPCASFPHIGIALTLPLYGIWILTNATVLRRISYRTSESPAGSDFKPSRYAIDISVSYKWRHRGTPRRMNERAPRVRPLPHQCRYIHLWLSTWPLPSTAILLALQASLRSCSIPV